MNKKSIKGCFCVELCGSYPRLTRKTFLLYLVFIIICVMLLFSACSSTQVQLSDKRSKGIELNQKAVGAFKKGEYTKALNYFSGALNISRSLEDADSIGNNIINIAYVYYKMGDMEKAQGFVDQIINSIPFPYSPYYLIDAMTLKALIFCESNRGEDASLWAEKALRLCENESCAVEGRIYNVMARISMLNKDNKTAMEFARRGLELNKKTNNLTEISNSMRIMADIELIDGNYDASLRFYQDAFLIDKGLELSDKMIMDLVGIASALEKQKKTGDAIIYYKRALSISQGTGNKDIQKSISYSIDRIKE